MTPLDRLRIEKAAVDCGFEMTPVERDGGLELHSARFPESVFVRPVDAMTFSVLASSSLLLNANDGAGTDAVEGYQALYEILRTVAAHARTLPNRVADAFRREAANLPRSTEAERVVVQRVGQNLFRAALLDYWRGRCCVTGLDVPDLLRASHIKPWAACDSDDERLDVFNGFLLAPQLDALFDSGCVTFEDDGTLRISQRLHERAWSLLALSRDMKVTALHDRHRHYLEFHRSNVWKE